MKNEKEPKERKPHGMEDRKEGKGSKDTMAEHAHIDRNTHTKGNWKDGGVSYKR